MNPKVMKASRGHNYNYVRKNARKSPTKTKKQMYDEHIKKERMRNITHNEPYCETNSPHGLSAQNWIASLGKRTANHKHRFVVKKGHVPFSCDSVALQFPGATSNIGGLAATSLLQSPMPSGPRRFVLDWLSCMAPIIETT